MLRPSEETGIIPGWDPFCWYGRQARPASRTFQGAVTMRRTLTAGDHTVELRVSPFSVEVVTYDGQEQSRQQTMWDGIHEFTVEEDGRPVHYRVEVGLRRSLTPYTVIQRDGQVLFDDAPPRRPAPWEILALQVWSAGLLVVLLSWDSSGALGTLLVPASAVAALGAVMGLLSWLFARRRWQRRLARLAV